MLDKSKLRNWNRKIFKLRFGLEFDGVPHIPGGASFAIRLDRDDKLATFETKSAHWHEQWRNVPLIVEWNGTLASLDQLSESVEPVTHFHFTSQREVMVHGRNQGEASAGHKLYVVPLSDAGDSGKWRIALQLFPWTGHEVGTGRSMEHLHLGIVHGDEP